MGDWTARARELALIGCASPPASGGARRRAGKMAAAALRLCWLLAAAAAGAEGAARTLVLLENSNLRDTHSLFFRSLAGRARGAAAAPAATGRLRSLVRPREEVGPRGSLVGPRGGVGAGRGVWGSLVGLSRGLRLLPCSRLCFCSTASALRVVNGASLQSRGSSGD